MASEDRMINECAAVGGMRTGRGNRNTQEKTRLDALYPAQIPHDLTWDGNRHRAFYLWAKV
jgi:hypothetical protein